MTGQLRQILFILLAVLFLTRCAQVAPLTGGKRDITAPKLISAIPANRSYNFNSDEVVLSFDEFVQLKDLNSQLVVSPKIKTQPEIEGNGKNVVIKLKKAELKPNTTYRIYFGQAIADMHEGNAIQNFEYIFSTGDYIDSLIIKGITSNAFNNKSFSNIVGLYEDLSDNDSLPYKDIPDYIAKSNDAGQFTFTNLPNRKFKVYAFSDKNKNYLYDGESEQIGFLNDILDLQSDTTLNISVFQEEATKGFIKKNFLPYYGFATILLSKKTLVRLDPLNPRNRENLYEMNVNQMKDTVSFYYKNIIDTLGLVLTDLSQNKTDTLNLVVPKKNQKQKKFKTFTLNTAANILPYGTKPTLVFNNWMDLLNTDVLRMKLSSPDDSLVSPDVKGKWLDITHYEITNDFKEGLNYKLKIDTNAFFDVNGVANDSLQVLFKTQAKAEFGKVTLKMLFNKKQVYIVQLINDKDQIVRENYIGFSLSSSNAASIEFADLLPGSYQVKVIYDVNANKKWDGGNLFRKLQPERVFFDAKQIKILSDWEIEEEIKIID